MDVSTTSAVVKKPRPCFLCGSVCVLLVIIGIILTTVIHDAVFDALADGLRDQFVLSSPNAADFGPWSNSSNSDAAVIFTAFYVYNYTNAYDVVNSGAKPIVEEVGPFTYYYNQQKLNVVWDPEEEGDVLEYNHWQYYTAADNRTRELEQAIFVTPNIPLIGVINNPRTTVLGSLLVDLINQAGEDINTLFVERPGYNVIWGWQDPVLETLAPVVSLAGITLPTHYPGLLENDTSPEAAIANHSIVRMYTGLHTTNLARQYIIWDGMSEMECCLFGPCGDANTGGNPVKPWMTEEAEDIRGGFGDQFHQFISPDEILEVSTHSFGIYRHWPLVSSEDSSYDVKGISLYRFQMQPGTLGNESVNPYEAFAYTNNGASGVLNQSQCEWGAPVFISKPRFYGASNWLRDGIANLPPATAEDCDTYLGVEPYTGATMDFHFRVSVNVFTEPTQLEGTSTVFFQNVNPAYLPVAFADRYGSATDSQVEQFKSSVYLARDLMLAARWGGVSLIAVSAIGAIVTIWLGFKRQRVLEKLREKQTAEYFAEYYRPFLAEGAEPAAAMPFRPVVGANDAAYEQGFDAAHYTGRNPNHTQNVQLVRTINS